MLFSLQRLSCKSPLTVSRLERNILYDPSEKLEWTVKAADRPDPNDLRYERMRGLETDSIKDLAIDHSASL